jgi:hypothetical protein
VVNESFVQSIKVAKADPQIVMCSMMLGIPPDCLPEMLDGLFVVAQPTQGVTEFAMRVRVQRGDLEGGAQAIHRLLQFPLSSQRGTSLSLLVSGDSIATSRDDEEGECGAKHLQADHLRFELNGLSYVSHAQPRAARGVA